jgi:hypothetical protein
MSPLQRGLAFYKGKTITFISPGTPGATYDIWARLAAPYFASILHATVNVVDIPAGATIAGQDAAEAAVPNGLTIGMMDPVTDATNSITHTPGTNFNAQYTRFIGAFGPATEVWITKPGSITSWAGAVNSPAKLTECVSVGYLAFLVVLANYLFHIPSTVLNGYGSPTTVESGYVRGDCDLVAQPLATVGPLIQAHQAVPLATAAKFPAGIGYRATVAGTPSIAQLAREFPPKTRTEKKVLTALLSIISVARYSVFVTSATPSSRVDALQYAMKKVMSNLGLTKTALNAGLPPGYETGTQLKKAYVALTALGAVIAPIVGNE